MKKFMYALLPLLYLGIMVSCGSNDQSKKANKETANTESQGKPLSDEAEPIDSTPRVYACAYDGFVNVRQTPDYKAPILGVFRNGPEGAILLDTEGEWTKIDCNGIVGYVLSKYVQEMPTVAVEEGITMDWLEGWWKDDHCQSLLVFDNGGYMEYSCMFCEGGFTSKGSFILQGSSLVLTEEVNFVNLLEEPDSDAETPTGETRKIALDPINKTIVGCKKEPLKTKELSQYMKELYGEDEWEYGSYDDLYLTKKDFNNLKMHVFDK